MKKRTKTLVIIASLTAISLIASLSAYTVISNQSSQVKEISKTNPLYQKGINLINANNTKLQQNTNNTFGTMFSYIPQIITNLGPVIYNSNSISLLNWFGNPIWNINLKTALAQFSQGIPSSPAGDLFPTGNVWSNMVYSPITNNIYILTLASSRDASSPLSNQYIVPININTGVVNTSGAKVVGSTVPQLTVQYQFKMLSNLSNGNIAMYWLGNAGITNGGNAYAIYNPLLSQVIISGSLDNISDNLSTITQINGFNVAIVNIIPFTSDRNLLILSNQGATNNIPFFGRGSLNSIVVNNQLEFIKDSSGNYVSQIYNSNSHIAYESNWQQNVNSDLLNQNVGYVPIYYTLFSGVIEIPIFNKMFFLTVSTTNPLGYVFTSTDLPALNSTPNNATSYPNNGTYFTGYFDSSGQLFFNMATYDSANNLWISSPTIYKLTYSNGLVNITTYVNLSTSSNSEITTDANRYVITSVPNQIGKIMLINAVTGISVAIDPSDTSSTGIILGTLNGTNPFVPEPDFSLTPSSYLTTPSQLTARNLDIAGGGAVSLIKLLPTAETNNTAAVPLSQIDTTGTVTIEAWLNYLPWFENAQTGTPTITPITKSFSGLKTIQDFGSWNNQLPATLSNLLPSLITEAQLETANPFNLNLPITVTTSTYIITADDTTGTLTLQYEVTYIVNLDSSIVLNYTSPSQTYTLSNSSDTASFIFLGGNLSTSSNYINNINNILQLLQFSKNDLLPSQVAANNSNAIIFANTTLSKKYPLLALEYSMVGNNTEGSVTVTVTISSDINSSVGLPANSTTIIKTFIGFNKISDYSFGYNFNNVAPLSTVVNTSIKDLTNTSIINKYSQMLASEVTVQNVFNDFLNIKGFDPFQAFNISFVPDNLTGELAINISLNSNYSYPAISNILPFQDGKITINIKDFYSSSLSNNIANQIQFVTNNNTNLLELQKQQASVVSSTNVLNELLIIGANLKSTLTISDISLVSNNNIGELTIIVSLNQNTINNVSLPTVFQHTYSGFLVAANSNFIFQPLTNTQLSASTIAFLSTATTSEIQNEIISNTSDFILQNKGFSLNSNNITVYINNYTKLVYITYDFSSQASIPNTISNVYSIVYSI